MKRFRTYYSGYTLLEILVVTTVGAILVIGGMATYSRFNERQKVAQAGLELATQLRIVQKQADTGEKPSGCDTLDYLELGGSSGEDHVGITAYCSTGISVTSLSLINGTTLGSDLPSSPPIRFLSLSKGVTGGDFDVGLDSAQGNCSVKVSISNGGAIDAQPVTCP